MFVEEGRAAARSTGPHCIFLCDVSVQIRTRNPRFCRCCATNPA